MSIAKETGLRRGAVLTLNYANVNMDQFLNTKYKLKSSDPTFEDYLKFLDIGLISRKTAISISPTAILSKDDNGFYTLSMSATFRTVKFTFKPGEEFIEERADGVKVKSIITIEGNKLIQLQIEDNGRKSTHVREFTEDVLTVTTTADGWNGKCIRIYERVK